MNPAYLLSFSWKGGDGFGWRLDSGSLKTQSLRFNIWATISLSFAVLATLIRRAVQHAVEQGYV